MAFSRRILADDALVLVRTNCSVGRLGPLGGYEGDGRVHHTKPQSHEEIYYSKRRAL